MTTLTIPRLQLQPFALEHLDGLHALNADPEVMRYISGRAETREETAASIERVMVRWAERGYSWWSFLRRDNGALIGAGCIQPLAHQPDNPLEIGWRLRRDHWGQGYASEAARRMAAFAFDTLDTPELVAVCHPNNTDSERVMRRLGMRSRGTGTHYGTTVLVYGVTRAEWSAQGAGAVPPAPTSGAA